MSYFWFKPLPLWARYLMPFIAIAVAAMARMLLTPYMGEYTPYTTFYPAVMLVAFYGGLWPGIIAMLIACFAASFWIAPFGSPLIPVVHILVGMVLFIASNAIIIGICVQLRKSQQNLRENEERLRMATEAAGTGHWDWDLSQNKLIWNEKCKLLFGLPPDQEISYNVFLRALHPEDRNKTDSAVRRSIECGEYDMEYRALWSDGTVRWIHGIGKAFCDKDGKPIRMSGIAMDITSRKLAEEVLEKQKAFFREVIDASPSMIFVKDWDGRFMLVNKSLANCYGNKINEIEGKTDSDFNANPDEVSHFRSDDREVMTTKQNKFIREEPVTCADGITRWFTTIKVPLINEDGTSNRVLGVATNITDRKRLEDALLFVAQHGWKAQDEDFFASVTQYLANAANVDYAFIGRLKEGNEIVQTIALYAKGQIHKNIEYQLEHTPCQNVVGQSLRSYSMDVQRLFPRDDLLKELSIESYIGMPLWDSHHLPIGLISVMHTKPIANPQPIESLLQLVAVRAAGELERRNADEQLQFQLELTQKIMDTAAVCMFVTDEKGYATYINPEAEKVFDFSLADLQGRILHDIIHHHYPDGRLFPIAECPISRIFMGGEPFRGYEGLFFHKDGSHVPVICSNMPIMTGQKMTGAVLVILDITERKRIEEALRENESRLKYQTAELETIIRIVSHDLRAPLMNVQGFNKFIKNDCEKIHKLLSPIGIQPDIQKELDAILDKSMIEATGFIESSAEAMSNLVETLVRVARAGMVVPHPETLDMNKLLADVVASIRIKFKDTGTHMDVNNLPPCFADKVHVTQIFTNLLDNAVKYLDQNRKGEICIFGCIEKDHVLYQVSDNGIGIAPEHQEKVFDVYYRIAEKSVAGGEGVGLSVVKRMIERNNGSIRLISEENKGSNFYITLPLPPNS